MKKKMIISSLAIVVLGALVIIVVKNEGFDQLNQSNALPKVNPKIDASLSRLPDFTVFDDVKEKKKSFFDFLTPVIIRENARVLKSRAFANELKDKVSDKESLTKAEKEWLTKMATRYRIVQPIEHEQFFDTLLRRVDAIPISLALAQAAIESGWGVSRFAKEGNNLFGHWCFRKGCGIVPSSRSKGRAHEVAKFPSVEHAVRSYVLNLNTLPAYKPLRVKRANSRSSGAIVSGEDLAHSLEKYSEQGKGYVKKVIRMIKMNKLHLLEERTTTLE